MNRLAVLILVLIACLFTNFSNGQNICPNPGFEQLSGCPTVTGEINLSPPWSNAGSPSDLFNFCHVNGIPAGCNDVGVPNNFAGVTTAHGGSSYAGFYTRQSVANQRTYVQAPLTSALLNGQLYKISAFFKRSSYSKYATNSIGISFSTGALSQTGGQFIPVTPQAEFINVIADTSNWTVLQSYYTGTGLEDQIIIGNFRSDASTTAFSFAVAAPACATMTDAAFYYVDDITVSKITEQLNVTGDTLICTGDSTVLTGITNTEGWWSLAATPTDTIPTINNSITVNPMVTTGYIWHGMQSNLQILVSVSAPPVVSLRNDTTVCDGVSLLLDANYASCTYLWSTGAITPSIMVSDSGQYVVTVNNGYCVVNDTFLLNVLTSPDVNLGEDKILCPDNKEYVILDAGSGGSYLWYPTGDTTAQISVTDPGIYAVLASNGNGCYKSDTVIVSEVCAETIFVPGAFTPNGDSKNDLFYADGTNILKYKIVIFNRWGETVFSSEILGFQGAWNGLEGQTQAPVGLYSYAISYEALKSNGKLKKENKSGYFILFR